MKSKTIITFIICLLAVFFTSCSNKDSAPEIIEVNIDDANKFKLDVEIESIIPFETKMNSLIGVTTKMKYFNHRYYIIDALRRKDFFVFDENGSLINSTNKGKGPGEVIGPFSFTINKNDSIVYMYDQELSSIFFFDKDLNFIRSEKQNDVFVLDYQHINCDTFLVYHHVRNRNNKRSKQFFNYALCTDGFTKEEHFNILTYGDKVHQILKSPINIFNNEILFVCPYNYNIYQLVEGKEKIQYQMDFGKYNFTSNELTTLSTRRLQEEIGKGKNIGVISGFFRTNDFFVFMTYFKKRIFTFFYSIENGKTYSLNNCFDSNLIPDCKIMGVTDDGIFYALIEPDKLIEFQKSTDRYTHMNVKESDNPCVIRFKVRGH